MHTIAVELADVDRIAMQSLAQFIIITVCFVPLFYFVVIRSVTPFRPMSIPVLSNVCPCSVQCLLSFYLTSVPITFDVRSRFVRRPFPFLFHLTSITSRQSSSIRPAPSIHQHPSIDVHSLMSVHRRSFVSTDCII